MKKDHDYAGNTFITMMLVMAVTVAFIAGALTYTQHLGRLSKRSRDAQLAMEIGDGCLENLFTHWRNIYRVLATGSPYVLSTNYFYTTIYHPAASPAGVPLIPTPQDSVNGSNLNLFPNVPQNFTILQYRIQSVDPMITLQTVGSDKEVSTMLDTDIPDGAYGPGLLQYSFYYLAAVDVQYPGLDGRTVTTKVRRVFEKQFNQPWTWAIAYNDNLEISPSASLTLNGKIQTNGNLYTGTSALTLTGQTNYVGSWNIGWAPGDTFHTAGTAVSPNVPANLPPAQGPAFIPFGWDERQLFDPADANTNNNGYREIIERPDTGTDPVSTQRYYNQADIRITIDSSGVVNAYNYNGVLCSNSSSNASDKAIFQQVKAAAKVGDTFQDNREGGTMNVTTIDLSKIVPYLSNGTIVNANSYGYVIHISDLSATSANHKAVRITNGAVVPSSGLTIVTDNPLYIKGDYNTGATGSSVPSNASTPDPTKPTTSNYTAAPCAIMADSITLQSNSWSDGGSSASIASGGRVASNTTINSALVSGIVPTANGNYSGGAENFVRFLENWTNKNFTYYGSMVQLWSSQLGTGTWGKANVYNAPKQNWYYDSQFKTKFPPGNLLLAGYLQQQRWYQVF